MEMASFIDWAIHVCSVCVKESYNYWLWSSYLSDMWKMVFTAVLFPVFDEICRKCCTMPVTTSCKNGGDRTPPLQYKVMHMGTAVCEGEFWLLLRYISWTELFCLCKALICQGFSQQLDVTRWSNQLISCSRWWSVRESELVLNVCWSRDSFKKSFFYRDSIWFETSGLGFLLARLENSH